MVMMFLLERDVSHTHDGHKHDKYDSRPKHRARKGVIDSEVEPQPKVYQRQQQHMDKVAPVGVDDAAQATLDYIAENLDVRYNVIGNDGGRFHVDIVLTNAGDRMIPACCWAIYLYHMKYDVLLVHQYFCICSKSALLHCIFVLFHGSILTIRPTLYYELLFEKG